MTMVATRVDRVDQHAHLASQPGPVAFQADRLLEIEQGIEAASLDVRGDVVLQV